MKIPNEEKTRWSALYQHGDYTAIQKESGLDRNVIAGAFAGDCSIEAYAAIKKFYTAREKKYAKFIEQ